jgi:pyruvate dehydrogenase E2 component (dihydrolipoamide acetyltransferase)
MPDVVMPRLSDSMEEGTILQWLKQVGEEIAVGDELVEIETDKANMAYESDVAGTLVEILAQEGETLPIGSPIARVGEPGEALVGASDEVADRAAQGSQGGGARPTAPGRAASPSDRPSPSDSSRGSNGEAGASEEAVVDEAQPSAGPGHDLTLPGPAEGPADHAESPPHGTTGRPKASPLARRMAKEKGVDLSKLRGSGPGGRIVKADVERGEPGAPTAAPTPPPAAVSEALETAKGQTSYQELTKLQSTIARRMAESKATAPHFYLEAEVDMSAAVKARGRIKAMAAAGEVAPSFNDMVVKACAIALREHPRANGAYRDGRFALYSRVNVGIAVAGQDALVVPTVFDADRKGLRQIATESRALAARVRDGQITPPELSGATFTVSNLGMYGIDSFSAVINPPQAAILAVGAIKERPIVRDGKLAPAHLMRVTLACDHRILYGAPAAEFLARVRTLLEEPLSLAL